MGVIEETENEKRFWWFLFLAGLIAGLILRFHLAGFARTPGHGDPAFYYTVARNLVDGRGLVVDYIAYFFEGLVPLTHYSSDFWNPLASVLLAIPMKLFGKSVANALLASIAASLVPPSIAFLAAKKYSGPVSVAALAGILAFFAPYQIWISVTTDANIFFGAFGATALYFAGRGFERKQYFLVAAVFSGLTHLTRQDGILMLAAIELSLIFAPMTWREKIVLFLGILGIHGFVLSPLLINNFVMLHSFFPKGPASTMFLTSYEDFHAYGKTLNWQTYRATWGLRRIFENKIHVALGNISTLNSFLDPLLALLTLLGLADLILVQKAVPKIRFLLPVLFFAGLEYAFYSIIATFSGPGSLPKSLAIIIPFAAVAILDLLYRYLKYKQLVVIAALLLAIYAGQKGYQLNYRYNTYYDGIYNSYDSVRAIILNDAGQGLGPPGSIVIMARDVWDVYEGTGFKAVMIPNNDLDTIYFIAQHYNVQYILLPAPRSALMPIYNGQIKDPRFVLVASLAGTDFRVFRINLQP